MQLGYYRLWQCIWPIYSSYTFWQVSSYLCSIDKVTNHIAIQWLWLSFTFHCVPFSNYYITMGLVCINYNNHRWKMQFLLKEYKFMWYEGCSTKLSFISLNTDYFISYWYLPCLLVLFLLICCILTCLFAGLKNSEFGKVKCHKGWLNLRNKPIIFFFSWAKSVHNKIRESDHMCLKLMIYIVNMYCY